MFLGTADEWLDPGSAVSARTDEEWEAECEAAEAEAERDAKALAEALRTGPFIPDQPLHPNDRAALGNLDTHEVYGKILERYALEDRLINHPIHGMYSEEEWKP
ncbi:hypothetical protein ATO13_22361 [Stappia sp. 22II-S9-Z10]|nr:hypothetical protein ATO13_22361 [Stappia sp. 22II-S9-Z10]